MPRIKRWFPLSHDINQDPEVWELTSIFGDRALRVWLECLSIADRNDGLVGMDLDSITSAVAYKCRCKTTRVRLQLHWITTQGWLRFDSGYRTRNHLKYHRTAEHKPFPSEPDRTKPEPDLKNAAPAADLKIVSSRKLVPAIKDAADPIYHSNPQKFARLVVWIKDKQKRDYADEIIIDSLAAFWDMEQKSKIKDWWPYIEKIFTKAYARWNEAQAAKHKSDDVKFIRDLVGVTSRILKA